MGQTWFLHCKWKCGSEHVKTIFIRQGSYINQENTPFTLTGGPPKISPASTTFGLWPPPDSETKAQFIPEGKPTEKHDLEWSAWMPHMYIWSSVKDSQDAFCSFTEGLTAHILTFYWKQRWYLAKYFHHSLWAVHKKRNYMDFGYMTWRHHMEFLTTRSTTEQCFYEWVPDLFISDMRTQGSICTHMSRLWDTHSWQWFHAIPLINSWWQ